MKVLLDTHAFLWMALDAPELSRRAKALIMDPANDMLVSVASLWEIGIKDGLGKIDLKAPLKELLAGIGDPFPIMRAPILDAHILRYRALPFHHRDPFDRMLIAQALSDDLTVVGSDAAFDAYGVRRVW